MFTIFGEKFIIMKNSGIGFMGLLTIVFIVLKLTNYINWSWWLVLLPIYGGVVLVLTIFGLYFLYLFIDHKIKNK